MIEHIDYRTCIYIDATWLYMYYKVMNVNVCIQHSIRTFRLTFCSGEDYGKYRMRTDIEYLRRNRI